MKILPVLIGMIGLLSLSAVQAAKAMGLPSGKFVLKQLFVDGEKEYLLEGIEAIPEFELNEGKLSGRAGVNRVNGALEFLVDGKMGKVEPFMTTRMAGPPEAMQLESQVMMRLMLVKQWRFRAATGELDLLDEGEKLVFSLIEKVDEVAKEKPEVIAEP